MAFSNNGLYLATASDKEQLFVFLKLRQGPNFTNSEEVPIPPKSIRFDLVLMINMFWQQAQV